MMIGTVPEGMRSLFVDLLTNGMRVRNVENFSDLERFKKFFCDYFEETIFHCMYEDENDRFLIEVKRDKTVFVVELRVEHPIVGRTDLALFSLPEESIAIPPVLRDVGLAATECFNGISSWNVLTSAEEDMPLRDPEDSVDDSEDKDKEPKDTPDFEWL